MVAEPMRQPARALHVVAEEQDPASPGQKCEVDGLVATIPAFVDAVRQPGQSRPRLAFDPVQSVPRCGVDVSCPALALEGRPRFRRVGVPPLSVGGVKDVGVGSEAPTVIDDDPADARGPDAPNVVGVEARAAGDTDDTFAAPATGDGAFGVTSRSTSPIASSS